MSIAAVAHYYTLPDTPYRLWVRDELADCLHLPDDGTRVEVIGGEIVVSPGPTFDRNVIVQDIQEAIFNGRQTDSSFPWRCIHTTDLNLVEISDGYIPDLIILDQGVFATARKSQAPHLFSHQTGLVVEVTSPSNAGNDRQPGLRRRTSTKWNGYAKAGIPWYLLVDRAPMAARSTLFAQPDRATGTYTPVAMWDFGETIELPEPFGVKIPTDEWEPWED